MSLIVAPEAVSVVSPPIVVRPTAPRSDTRPVEDSDRANTGTSQQKQDSVARDTSAKADTTAKAEPSARPPGTDPSLPPQAIFDASLISEDYKPTLRTAEPQSSAATGANDESGETVGAADNDDSPSGGSQTASTASSQDGSHPFEVSSIASYARVGSGSALNTPAAAHPDWLTAIEKIA